MSNQQQIDEARRRRQGLEESSILSGSRQRFRPDGTLEGDYKPIISDEHSIPAGAAGLMEIQRRGMIMYTKLLSMRDPINPAFYYHVPFLELPSSLDYPDYYIMIKKPICLNEIKTKLDRLQYTLLYDVRLDFNQLFVNAKRYNAPGSPIFLIAKQMHRVIKDMYSQATGTNFEESEEDEPPIQVSQQRAPTSLFKAPPNAAGTMSKRGPTLKPWLTRKMVETTSYKDPQTGRNIADDFKSLPAKSVLPQYFSTIKHPMSFDNVSAKCLKRAYLSVGEFIRDVELILSNAQRFHKNTSRMYSDAETLRAHFKEVMKEVPPLFATPRKYNTARRRAEKEGGGGSNSKDSKLRRQLSVSEGPEDDYEEEYSQAGTPDYEQIDYQQQFEPEGSAIPSNSNFMEGGGGEDEFQFELSPINFNNGLNGFNSQQNFEAGDSGSAEIINPFNQLQNPFEDYAPTESQFELNFDQGVNDLLAIGAGNGRMTKSVEVLPRERIVARVVQKEEAPGILYFTIHLDTMSSPIILHNSSLRQHSLSIPLSTQNIQIIPSFSKPIQSPSSLIKLESSDSTEPFLSISVRPEGIQFHPLLENEGYSLEARDGLSVVEFMISSAGLALGREEVYRIFITR